MVLVLVLACLFLSCCAGAGQELGRARLFLLPCLVEQHEHDRVGVRLHMHRSYPTVQNKIHAFTHARRTHALLCKSACIAAELRCRHVYVPMKRRENENERSLPQA